MTKNIRTHQCLKSIVKGEEIHAASSMHVFLCLIEEKFRLLIVCECNKTEVHSDS